MQPASPVAPSCCQHSALRQTVPCHPVPALHSTTVCTPLYHGLHCTLPRPALHSITASTPLYLRLHSTLPRPALHSTTASTPLCHGLHSILPRPELHSTRGYTPLYHGLHSTLTRSALTVCRLALAKVNATRKVDFLFAGFLCI